ncbi:MAG: tyrosine-protein kinase family protein, partial [Rubripirellula sp.]
LLIDADLRRPTQQDMFRKQSDLGFARVLTGESEGEISDTIIPGVVHNLDLMLCGKPPANPAEVLCSGSFANMLDRLREQYDYVIIDSAPVLAVTDPSNIAPLTDGVVVTFRLRRDARPSALQTIKQLDGVGATLLGVVVNDVGDYYSGSSNGYSYTDSYGYGYVDNSRLNDYFKPNEAESTGPRKKHRKAEQPLISQPLPSEPPYTQT